MFFISLMHCSSESHIVHVKVYNYKIVYLLTVTMGAYVHGVVSGEGSWGGVGHGGRGRI